MSSRTIAVVTSSRADFSHLFWPLRHLEEHADVRVHLMVTGAHLSPEFGRTVDVIRDLGFRVDEEIECLLSSDSDVGMAKTIGLATVLFAESLGRLRPDLLLLIADRYEMLAPASAALALRLPIAHIEGGEASEGAVDQAVRNALTMMSHLHFVTTPLAAERVIAMGEQPWRVHHVGAASLDHLHRSTLLDRDAVADRLRIDLNDGPTLLVGVHPVTLDRDPVNEAQAVFAAVERLPHRVIFSFPNADTGSRQLIDRAQALAAARTRTHLVVNLEPVLYWSLLRTVDAVCGNSSSGVMESPSVGVPAVDVGRRQQGRERARSVLHAAAEPGAIAAAVERVMDEAFRRRCRSAKNPYGDGRAGERIARILASTPLGERLLQKPAMPAAHARILSKNAPAGSTDG